MRIKKGFEMRTLFTEHVLLANGEDSIDFSKIISLNPTAAFMWETAEKAGDFTAQSLADAVLAEYEVDAATALKDAGMFVQRLLDEGVLEE